MNQSNIFTNNNYEEDTENQGILSKTGNMISSFFVKVKNSINPFRATNYIDNPYDINSLNDPYNNLNYIDSINNGNLPNSNIPPNYNNLEQIIRKNKYSTVYLRDNNFEEILYNNNNHNNYENVNICQEDNNYLSVEELCNMFPHFKNDIFKDYKRPNYIPNEEIFQEAKKYVYENLVNKYKILKPKINEEKIVESIILLSIQLVNKYNIDAHYDFLVNKKKCVYKLIIDVPDIIKKYYSNKAKSLFFNDINNCSEIQNISNDLNKEILNKFSSNLFSNKINNRIINFNNGDKIICRTPKTKRNYITSLLDNNFNYEYLNPNDKFIIQAYKDSLMRRETQLRDYARVIEVTNNMFKFLCNENEKLKEELNQKNIKIENYSKEIMLNKINNKDINQQIINYKNQISNLVNNQKKNKFENLQKTNFITNYTIINSNNNNIFKINTNENIFNKNNNININNKKEIIPTFCSPENQNMDSNNLLLVDSNQNQTEKKNSENKNEFTFGNKGGNSLKRDNRSLVTNTSMPLFSCQKEEKNNKDSNPFIGFRPVVNDSYEQNKTTIIFGKQDEQNKTINIFNSSVNEENNENYKGEEEKNVCPLNISTEKKSESKNDNNIFSFIPSNISSNNKVKFEFISNKKEEEDEKKEIIESKNKTIEIKENTVTTDIKSEKKENENKENKEKENIENKENNENTEKNEIINNDKIGNEIKKDKEQKKNKEDSQEKNITENSNEMENEENVDKTNIIITKKEESFNNPGNHFLSSANISSNKKDEFNPNIINISKNKNDNNNQNETRSTIENTNQLINLNESSISKNTNENRLSESTNNPFLSNTMQSKDSTFLNINNTLNNELNNKNNPFLSQQATSNINNSLFIFNASNLKTSDGNTTTNTNNIFMNNNINNNKNTSNLNLSSQTSNIFLNNKNDENINTLSNINSTSNMLNQNNKKKTSNNSINISYNNSNNPFLTLNNNKSNSSSNNTINPFLANNSNSESNNISSKLFSTQIKTETYKVNNNTLDNSSKDSNPFLSQQNNTNFNNNNNNLNNSNPFLTSNANNNNYSNTNTFSNNNMSNNNSNPFLSSNNNISSNNYQSTSNNISNNVNPFTGINNNNTTSSSTSSLFSFKIHTNENNSKVNPFLNCQNGFNFGGDNSSCGFSLGLKTNNNNQYNNTFSLFGDNKQKKRQGFFN